MITVACFENVFRILRVSMITVAVCRRPDLLRILIKSKNFLTFSETTDFVRHIDNDEH